MAAAVLFEQQFKSGDTRGFWQGSHLPMLDEVLSLPRTQEFLKSHKENTLRQKAQAQKWLESRA